jgi:HJR/Mrr/RecB family endonuclease
MVITNYYFTKSAKELAEISDVILWNRDILKEKISLA